LRDFPPRTLNPNRLHLRLLSRETTRHFALSLVRSNLKPRNDPGRSGCPAPASCRLAPIGAPGSPAALYGETPSYEVLRRYLPKYFGLRVKRAQHLCQRTHTYARIIRIGLGHEPGFPLLTTSQATSHFAPWSELGMIGINSTRILALLAPAASPLACCPTDKTP
jgi:hypothetical protein